VIDEIISVDGEQTMALNIRLSVNFNAVYHVYIVRNRFADEQKKLESDFFEGDE